MCQGTTAETHSVLPCGEVRQTFNPIPRFSAGTIGVYEYDCATREWSNLDYNDMHAK